MFGCLAESSMRSLSAKWNGIRIPVTATLLFGYINEI